MPEAEWIKAFLQFGGFSVLAWLVWFLFTKWMPARDAEHAKLLIDREAANAKMMAEQRADFRAELANERQITAGIKDTFEKALQSVSDRHKDQMQAMWARIDQQTAQRDRRDEKITEALNKALDTKP
jgi:hypothetical protein